MRGKLKPERQRQSSFSFSPATRQKVESLASRSGYLVRDRSSVIDQELRTETATGDPSPLLRRV